MITYETKTSIEKPLKEVYEAISDPTRVKHWLQGLEKLEPISGTPMQVGFKSKYTFVENGRTAIFHEEMTAVSPYESFTYILESDSLTMEGHTQMGHKNGKTKLTVSNKVKGKTLGMKIMMPFLKGMMRKRQIQDFARFKAMLEGNG